MSINAVWENTKNRIRRRLNRNSDPVVLGDVNANVQYEDDPQSGLVWARRMQANGTFGPRFLVRGSTNPSTNIPGIPVELGIDKQNRQHIQGIDFAGAQVMGVNPTQYSSTDPNTNNPAFVNQSFITTAYLQIVEGTLKFAVRGWLSLDSGVWYKFEKQGDLSGNIPGSGDHCVAVIAVLRDYTDVEIQYSTAKDVQIPLDLDDLQEAWDLMSDPILNIPIGAFDTGDGQTTLTESDKWLDARQLINLPVIASGGTVTSVAATATPTSVFNISVANPTTTPSVDLSMDNQSANTVLAGPTTGGAAQPAFRALVAADIPSLLASKISDFATQVNSLISAAIGVTVQAYSAALSQIAALTPSANQIIKYVGGVWTAANIYYQTLQKAGSSATQRSKLNFLEGTNITITLADNSGSDSTDVTIGASDNVSSKDLFVETSNATVSNTTSETTLLGSGVGSLTLGANALIVGKGIEFEAWGIMSTLGALPGTLNIKFKLGSTVIVSTGAVSLIAGLASVLWKVRIVITCVSVGSSGTVIAEGKFSVTNTLADTTEQMTNGTSTITINTTTTQTIDLTATFGTASGSNSITSTNALVRFVDITASSGAGIDELTGDVIAGPGSGSQAATLATVNSNVGTFSRVKSVTANAKGLITAITQGLVDLASEITGLLGLANGGTNVNLSATGGTTKILAQDASHVISARDLVAADIPNLDASKITSGKVALARITTGSTSGQALLAGATDPAYGALNLAGTSTVSGALPLANLADGATAGIPLVAGGSGGDPSYTALDLSQSSAISNALGAANGGTGRTSLTAHDIITGNGTGAVNFLAPGSKYNVVASDSTDFTSSGLYPPYLDVNNAQTSFSNSNAENTFDTWQLDGGILGINDGVWLRYYMTILNNSAATRTYTIRVKYGATTILTFSFSPTASATTRITVIDIYLSNNGATNSQTAIGNVLSSTSTSLFNDGQTGTAAEDSTANKNIVLTVQSNSNVATQTVALYQTNKAILRAA